MKRSLLKWHYTIILFAGLFLSALTASAQNISTIAGTTTTTYNGEGIPATTAGLFSPFGVAVDASGNVYIADFDNQRVQKVNAGTGTISTIAGTGTGGYNGDGIAATAAELNGPAGVTLDASGNIYITENSGARVREVNASTGLISTIAGITGTPVPGYNGDGIAATAAELKTPWACAVDGSGNVYIGDAGNDRVREVNAATGIITTVAGTGTTTTTYNGDNIAATTANLAAPRGVAVDAAGNIYIAVEQQARIRKVNTSGIITTIAGTGNTGGSYNGNNIAATSQNLDFPTGVRVDAAGNVYIAGYDTHCVQKVNTSGILTTLAGTGTAGFSGDGGPATAALLDHPNEVAVDNSGNVYIVDNTNNRIREIFAPGCSTVTAGTISNSGSNNFCASGSSTLTLTGATAGTGITYQWQSSPNGTGSWANVGTNATTYATGTITATTYYQAIVTCTTSSLTATTPVYTITVNPTVTPTLSIGASASTICQGTSVSFTATPTNGGGTPSYQWIKNGNNVGTNSNIYTDNALANGNTVYCVLTSNAACTMPTNTVTSNTVTMTVNPTVTPTISISASATTICAGTAVTFTATPTNGGATPSYQWVKNGSNAGTNNNTYTDNGLSNGNTVYCVLTSNAACTMPTNTVTSNTVTMTVNPTVTPTVSISASATTICAGTAVTFTATPTNGGAAPSYQWVKNGSNVGTNNNTYSNNGLTNGNTVYCVLTSNTTCTIPSVVTSNTLTMTVNPTVAPTVSISTSATTICQGVSVTFTATPVNGGAAPSYQWTKNGSNVGTNSNTYTDNGLANGNTIACLLTSNATCAIPSAVTSNTVTMTVNPTVTPTVSISTASTSICPGASVTFTATPVNGGATPSYQWTKNGSNVGTNSNIYTDNTLTNGNTIACMVTSNATCATPAAATSNTLTITVNGTVSPTVSISSDQGNTVCAGAAVTFTATATNSGANPSYQWVKNGSIVSGGGASYTDNSLASGNTISCILTSNATCAMPAAVTSNTLTMTVNASVMPTVYVSATSTTICEGTAVTFTATPTNGGAGPAYQWMKNGNPVGAASDTYTDNTLANGNTIACILTSNATCATPAAVTSNTLTMTVNPTVMPTVSISANPGDTVCAGYSITFTATSVNGGSPLSYQWENNGNPAGTNSSTYIATAPVNNDLIACVITSNNACAMPSAAASNTITVTVNPLPQPVITANGNVLSTGTYATYQWSLNSSAISGATNQSYTATQNGAYHVTVTDADGCSATSVADTVSTVDVAVISGNNNVRVYPNPNTGAFTVEGSFNNDKQAEIEIVNVIGQTVYKDIVALQNGKLNKQISLQGKTANGLYLLSVKTDNAALTVRFVVSNL